MVRWLGGGGGIGVGEWRVVGENNKAYRAFKKGDWAAAGAMLERLAVGNAEHPRAKVWAFDAALSYKFLRDWPKAYELGKIAASYVEREQQDPAFWNLGIAATVLREWTTARDAWAGYGIGVPVPDGDGPPVLDLGMTPVRLDPQGAGEVVWARRLCPARARILNVPSPESGRRFGEVVVHDGVPNGERVSRGRAFAVFDELVPFEASDLPTSVVTIEAPAAADVEALVDLFLDEDYGAEPASNFSTLCKTCSQGSVHHEHEGHQAGRQTVWLAAPEDELDGLLDRWRMAGRGRLSVRSGEDGGAQAG